MREIYLANVTIHVLAALFWIGGMLFFALVGAPALLARGNAVLGLIVVIIAVRLARGG